jgi:hypothetical protein
MSLIQRQLHAYRRAALLELLFPFLRLKLKMDPFSCADPPRLSSISGGHGPPYHGRLFLYIRTSISEPA